MAEMNTRQQALCTFSPLKADDSPGEIETATFEIVGATGTLEVLDFLVEPTMVSFRMHALATSTVGAKVVVTGDADMGEGVSPIVGETPEFTIVLAPEDMASHFAITVGEPEPFPG